LIDMPREARRQRPLLPPEIRASLPPLYSQEALGLEALALVKFVVPPIVWPRRGTKSWPILGPKCHSVALLRQVLAMFEAKQQAIGSKGWPKKHKSRPKGCSVSTGERCAQSEAFLPINQRWREIGPNQPLVGLKAMANRLGTDSVDIRLTFGGKHP
jgi:hypothetical protein